MNQKKKGFFFPNLATRLLLKIRGLGTNYIDGLSVILETTVISIPVA